MTAWLARLRAAYEGLSSRERLLVLGAGGMLALAVIFLGIVSPILRAATSAGARVGAAEQELEAVRRLRREYDEVHGRLAAVEAQIRNGPRGEIFTTLEKLASDSAVKVDAMEPRTAPASEAYKETKVQVSLKGVTLAQLVNYLHRIDASEQVLSIKSLRIRTRKDKPELLDVTFTVSSFEPA
jgi:type II secretory pathway component PulM